MPPEDTTTGATLGAGATPAAAGPATVTTPAAGATPPASTTPATPQQPQTPATGEEALGEPGKAILREARAAAKAAEDRAKAAESERDQLRDAGKTEAEKATSAAVKAAEQAVTERYQGQIRGSEVRRALTAAGIAESEIGLAAVAPEFAKLKLSDAGEVEKLSETVEAFKAAHPGLFSKPGDGIASLGGGVRPGAGTTLTRDQIKGMSEAEINARWPEVQQVLAANR